MRERTSAAHSVDPAEPAPPRWLAAAVGAASLACGIALFARAARPGSITPDQDFLRFLVDRESIVSTIRQFGEFPYRSPYLGGGVPIFAHPHEPTLHPWFLASLLFGPLAGLKFKFVAAWAAAVLGSWALASRALALHPAAMSFLVLSVASLNWPIHRMLGGDVPELQYLYAPLLLALCLISRRSRSATVAASLLLCCISLVAAYRTLLIAAVPALWMLGEALAPPLRPAPGHGSSGAPSLRRDAALLGGISLAALLLAMPRLLPVLPAAALSPRSTAVFIQPFQDLPTLLRMLAVSPTAPGALHQWNHQVGPLALVLAPLAFLRPARALPALALGLPFFALATGPHSPLDPWPLLSRTPVLSAMTSAPKQASFPLMMAILLAAAHAVDHGARWVRGRAARDKLLIGLVFSAALATQTLHLAERGAALSRLALPGQWLPAAQRDAARWIAEGQVVDPTEGRQPLATVDYSGEQRPNPVGVREYSRFEFPVMLYWLRAGYAQPGFWDAFFEDGAVTPSARWSADLQRIEAEPAFLGEVRAADGSDCVRLEGLSALRLTLRNACAEPMLAVLNQRWDPAWRGPVEDHGGRLAVRLAAGERRELRYAMTPLWAGVPAFLGALLGLGAWLRRGGSGDRRLGAALLVAAGLYGACTAGAYAMLRPRDGSCLPTARPTLPLPAAPAPALSACGPGPKTPGWNPRARGSPE